MRIFIQPTQFVGISPGKFILDTKLGTRVWAHLPATHQDFSDDISPADWQAVLTNLQSGDGCLAHIQQHHSEFCKEAVFIDDILEFVIGHPDTDGGRKPNYAVFAGTLDGYFEIVESDRELIEMADRLLNVRPDLAGAITEAVKRHWRGE